MNWNKATPAEIAAKIDAAIVLDEPQFFNPLEAVAAIAVRDRVLAESDERRGDEP